MSDSPQYPPVPPQSAQSGLTDSAAGALAYVTIIPAIIFLLVEPYNKNSFVRFHSWQCIFLSIAAFAVQVVLTVIPVIGWVILPFAAVGILVLWVYVLLKALKGERYELPFIGKYAAQQAGA
jgi:uncharacterized membrane protein